MELLKKENWIVNLILLLLTQGLYIFVLAYNLKCYSKDAWYTKWPYWVFGGLCLFFPLLIMLEVFMIQMECSVAKKLNVPGEKIYNTPYTWILCMIVPIIGWTLLIVMAIYVYIWPIVMLKKGEGEKYLV